MSQSQIVHPHLLQPWYREPWPWLLMAGPAAVILAGMVTVWLALTSNDGLVSDDYYKQGLAVNQVLSRDAAASALSYRARVTVAPDENRITVSMNLAPRSSRLVLRVVHPTRPGRDLVLPLTLQPQPGVQTSQTSQSAPGGHYVAALPPLAAGRWRLELEDHERAWRLVGELRLPGTTHTELTARGQ